MADSSTIDKELYDGLQQCRKKKPRYFCVVAKGAEVVKMIVQKKKINDGQAQKAKSENKGNLVVTGIVIGEGMDLSFEITGAEPSITPKRIKDYISDNTDLTLKPKWTVVTELRQVEEESEGKESEGQQKSPVPPPVPPTAQKPPGVTPPVPPPPPGGPKSEAPKTEAPKPEPPKTEAPKPEPKPQVPDAPPIKPSGEMDELIAKMSKLMPAITAAAGTHPQRKGDLLAPVAAFKIQSKANDVEGAKESLRRLAVLLKELSTSGATPPVTPPTPPGTQPKSEVPPQAPGAKGEREQGESEGETDDAQKAEEAADRFRQKWAAARKELRLAIDKVEQQLSVLAESLLKSNDPNMAWVAENGLTLILGGLRASATAIDKTGSKTPEKTAAFAKPALAELEKQLDSARVQACDQNQFGVKVSVKKTIGDAIDKLAKTLETAAV